MIKLLFVFISFSSLIWHFNKVSLANNIKKEAEVAYQNENYIQSVNLYYLLVEKYQQKNESILSNLANSYFMLGAYEPSKVLYLQLLKSKNILYSSSAQSQLGILSFKEGKKTQALTYLKSALIENPKNEVARFNYEFIKKNILNDTSFNIRTKVSQKNRGGNTALKNINSAKDNSNNSQKVKTIANNKNVINNNTNNSDTLGMNQKPSEEQNKSDNSMSHWKSNKTNVENVSKDKAYIILENMRQQEIQFIQQLKPIKNRALNNSNDW